MVRRRYYRGKPVVENKAGGIEIPVVATPVEPVFNAEMFVPHAFETRRLILNPSFHNPRIEIPVGTCLDMYHIAGYAGHNEVGWLGTVEREGDVLRLGEIFLFQQEVTSSSTELNSEHIAEVATKLISEGAMDKVNALKFWGHVHPSNSTSPSQQDDDTMDILEDGNAWFLRGIFGRNGRAEFTLFDYAGKVEFQDVPWKMIFAESEERKASIRDLIDDLVHPVYTTPSSFPFFNNFGGVNCNTGFPRRTVRGGDESERDTEIPEDTSSERWPKRF